MALALKFFADGQLSATPDSSLYAPVGSVAITAVIVCNTSGSAVTVNLYARKGAGTSRRVFDKNYSIPAGESRVLGLDRKVILENGDTLRGDASTGAVVDYVVMGFTE